MVNATKEVEAIVLARNVHLAPFVVHENVREKKREKKTSIQAGCHVTNNQLKNSIPSSSYGVLRAGKVLTFTQQAKPLS